MVRAVQCHQGANHHENYRFNAPHLRDWGAIYNNAFGVLGWADCREGDIVLKIFQGCSLKNL